jgi:hypothetical protein
MTGEEIAVLLTVAACIALTVVCVFCALYARRAAEATKLNVVVMQQIFRDWERTMILAGLVAAKPQDETKAKP